jgi:hypothetical protein
MKIEDRFYVQACVEDAEGKNVTEALDGEEPNFHGVYERLADGTSTHLADFKYRPDAEATMDAIVDVLHRWIETDMPAAVDNGNHCRRHLPQENSNPDFDFFHSRVVVKDGNGIPVWPRDAAKRIWNALGMNELKMSEIMDIIQGWTFYPDFEAFREDVRLVWADSSWFSLMASIGNNAIILPEARGNDWAFAKDVNGYDFDLPYSLDPEHGAPAGGEDDSGGDAGRNLAEMLAALKLAQQALNTAPRFPVPSVNSDSYRIAEIVDNAINAAGGTSIL